jgi:hypothetical protein
LKERTADATRAALEKAALQFKGKRGVKLRKPDRKPGSMPRRRLDGWEWKREWYAQNGYAKGRNLFTTTEEQIRDMDLVDKMAKTIQAAWNKCFGARSRA